MNDTKYYFFTYQTSVNGHVRYGSGVTGSGEDPTAIFREIVEGLHAQLEDKEGQKEVLITDFKLIF